MDCLIKVERAPGQSLVRVIGQLTQAQVSDLLQACDAPKGWLVTVDLTELVSTDAVGLQALRRVRADGVRVTNMPRYIQSDLDI